MNMASKLRIKLSESLLRRVKGYTMLNEYDIEGVVNDAFSEWLDANSDKSSIKRVVAILPIDANILKSVREFARLQGLTSVRAVEDALEGYLARHLAVAKTADNRESDAADRKIDTANQKSDAVDVGKVTCRQCGHTWKPRTDSPPLCPACKRTDWNVPWTCSQCGNEEPVDRRAASGLLCVDCHSQIEG